MESASGPEEADAPEDDASPAWFDSRTSSASDSAAFYGFSLAAASDSSEAAELSADMALQNLRFEIDRFADQVREKTQEDTGSGRYQSKEFIMSLRNSVQALDLSEASLTQEHRTNDNSVHHFYTRAELPARQVKSILANSVNDEAFRQAVETSGE